MQRAEWVRDTETQRERERVLKADLTLGSVTTDQNPLKAIDPFHYSSHVPHLETVYQTEKSLCAEIHTPTHARTHIKRGCLHVHIKQCSFRSEPAALKHLYGLSLSANKRLQQSSTQPSSVRSSDAHSAYK